MGPSLLATKSDYEQIPALSWPPPGGGGTKSGEARKDRRLVAAFGWALNVGEAANPRSVRTFPPQANGAEMLRLACCFLTEGGIRVCAPVHDALLVEAREIGIEGVVEVCQKSMAEASELVLDGFSLRTEAKVVRYPDVGAQG